MLWKLDRKGERSRAAQEIGRGPTVAALGGGGRSWELSEKHSLKLPGPGNGPRRFADLPPEVFKPATYKEILPFQRKKHVNDACQQMARIRHGVHGHRARRTALPWPRRKLGPCKYHPNEFDPPVTQFIDHTLIPKLTDKEKDELKTVEGRWPEYPKGRCSICRRSTASKFR